MEPAPRPPRRRWRLSITGYLTLGLGGLVFVAMAGVLAYTLGVGFINTRELLEDKSRLLIGALVTATHRHLNVVRAPAEFISSLVESGRLHPDDRDRLLDLCRAALAATPHVQAIAYIDARGWYAATYREGEEVREEVEAWSGDDLIEAAMIEAEARARSNAYWAAPVYFEEAGTNLNLRRPIFRDGSLAAMVVVTVRVAELSRFIASLETEIDQVAFILYDRDYVVAHRALESGFPGLGPDRPLPRVTEIDDPVLINIWRPGWQERRLEVGQGHHDEGGEEDHIFLYSSLQTFGDAPWLVGSYFAAEAIGAQVFRMFRALAVGVVALVAAVAAALLLGKALRAPIARLSDAAEAIRSLDLDRVPVLPGSRFRELDDAARAFNAMVSGLRAFALYVPRHLVLALIRRGEVGALRSESREVTVMFTDVVGFTTLTETLGPEATVEFLDRHFELVAACIEAEGGTVDKYIGDAVMALWGAIEDQPDHAARAGRAACAIGQAVAVDNAGRSQPVRMRLGVHSGPVVVGNIGTPTRMNYTVVGDTVNTAQRLEALAKELRPAAEVTILLSAATVASLPPELRVECIGCHRLRGHVAETEVFTLST